MSIKYKFAIYLIICLICCEFSEENPQGPQKSKKDDSEEETRTSNHDPQTSDPDDFSALKIVPAPDLVKDRDHKKGKVKIRMELQDTGSISPFRRNEQPKP